MSDEIMGNDDCDACGGNGTVYLYNEDGIAVGREACPWCNGGFELDDKPPKSV